MILQKEFQNPYDTEITQQKKATDVSLHPQLFNAFYKLTSLSAAFCAAARAWAAFWCTFLWALFT